MCEAYEKSEDILNRLKNIKPSEEEPDIGTVLSTLGDSVIENSSSNIGIEVWEALAYDLALAMVDEATIVSEYGITIEYLASLKNNVFFMKMYNNKCEEVKALGADADFKVKMRMIVSRAIPQLLKRLTSASTTTKDFHGLFKTAVDLASLTPEENGADGVAGSGNSIVFNISGVPGLEHLGKGGEIIEHESCDRGSEC